MTAGENRVQRLCRDHSLWSVFSKKHGLNRKPGPPVHDDLVERVYVAQLRRKLEPGTAKPRRLLTGAGLGYRFMPERHAGADARISLSNPLG